MIYKDFFYWQTEAYRVLAKLCKNRENVTIDKVANTSFDPVMHHPIISTNDYNVLVMIIGQLKSYFSNFDIQILFRGQRNDHNFRQFPKMYRNNEESIHALIKDGEFGIAFSNYLEFLRLSYEIACVKENKEVYFKEFNNPLAWEATLQHYGWNTRWIDLVDNLQVALWFALFKYKYDREKEEETVVVSDSEFSYVFVYAIKANEKIGPGIFEGKEQRLINLREAVSPIALRPHNQHAFSMASLDFLNLDTSKKSYLIDEITSYANYNEYVLCVIKIKTSILNEWFTHTSDEKENVDRFLPHRESNFLFPRKKYDSFFRDLDKFSEHIDHLMESTEEVMKGEDASTKLERAFILWGHAWVTGDLDKIKMPNKNTDNN